jgi:putative intracellular protease/amidase
MSNDFHVVFALFPRITQLDFTGPFEVFARLPGARCLLASVEGGTIQGDGGITFANVARLRDIPSCTLLCVPGGFGTVAAIEDARYLAEIRRLAAHARYVTSVCTGSLLRGRRDCWWVSERRVIGLGGNCSLRSARRRMARGSCRMAM